MEKLKINVMEFLIHMMKCFFYMSVAIVTVSLVSLAITLTVLFPQYFVAATIITFLICCLIMFVIFIVK